MLYLVQHKEQLHTVTAKELQIDNLYFTFTAFGCSPSTLPIADLVSYSKSSGRKSYRIVYKQVVEEARFKVIHRKKMANGLAEVTIEDGFGQRSIMVINRKNFSWLKENM